MEAAASWPEGRAAKAAEAQYPGSPSHLQAQLRQKQRAFQQFPPRALPPHGWRKEKERIHHLREDTDSLRLSPELAAPHQEQPGTRGPPGTALS